MATVAGGEILWCFDRDPPVSTPLLLLSNLGSAAHGVAENAASPADAVAGVGLHETLEMDDLRSSDCGLGRAFPTVVEIVRTGSQLSDSAGYRSPRRYKKPLPAVLAARGEIG
jgi:hypothetical protein